MEKVFFGIMAILILGLIVCMVDCSVGHNTFESGVVVEKVFSPGKTGVGVGPNIGGNGGATVVVTSSIDEWHILVKTKTGLVDVKVDKEQWVIVKVGDMVTVKHWVGGMSGSIYDSTIK
jgi:hypothetical protein